MTAITKRLSDLELDVEDLRRRKSFIPVLFVTEYPEGIYTGHNGAIFNSEAELQQFAGEHGTVAIINNDTKLKRGQTSEVNYSVAGSTDSPQIKEVYHEKNDIGVLRSGN